ncbi:MAG TPA: hypothetical protein DD473_02755 [Planctomycetaceae bacterium]|nr:hypothetical protein [Planctomycetaceae bacterium]|tara:strand:+ start:90 stop:317 length:228 start_codon:yes stop_codon:yes gene_type:complete
MPRPANSLEETVNESPQLPNVIKRRDEIKARIERMNDKEDCEAALKVLPTVPDEELETSVRQSRHYLLRSLLLRG